MHWVSNRFILLYHLLYLLLSITPANLQSPIDNWEEIPEEPKLKDKSEILAEKKEFHRSAWFHGPPRLKCQLPPGANVSSALFLDSYIVECMRDQPYDTSQLPLQKLGLREMLNLRYLFSLNNLVDVDKDGKLTLVMTLKLVWYINKRP